MVQNPNSLANLKPFEPGHDPRRNVKGGRRASASIKEWWDSLSIEDEHGVAKYSMAQIKAFADAPDDDESISPAKRIAARHLVEMAKGGRTGREITALLFDRIEGKSPSYMTVAAESADLTKRIILIDPAAPPGLPGAVDDEEDLHDDSPGESIVSN